jgi:hypothetical protein
LSISAIGLAAIQYIHQVAIEWQQCNAIFIKAGVALILQPFAQLFGLLYTTLDVEPEGVAVIVSFGQHAQIQIQTTHSES